MIIDPIYFLILSGVFAAMAGVLFFLLFILAKILK